MLAVENCHSAKTMENRPTLWDGLLHRIVTDSKTDDVCDGVAVEAGGLMNGLFRYQE